jgi:hypothetical protein
MEVLKMSYKNVLIVTIFFGVLSAEEEGLGQDDCFSIMPQLTFNQIQETFDSLVRKEEDSENEMGKKLELHDFAEVQKAQFLKLTKSECDDSHEIKNELGRSKKAKHLKESGEFKQKSRARPVRDAFELKSDYWLAYSKWLDFRKSNNESVKKSRARNKELQKDKE